MIGYDFTLAFIDENWEVPCNWSKTKLYCHYSIINRNVTRSKIIGDAVCNSMKIDADK